MKDDTQLRVCSFPDDQGCTFIFRYLIDNTTVEVQRTRQCGGEVNILGECYGLQLWPAYVALLAEVVSTSRTILEHTRFLHSVGL